MEKVTKTVLVIHISTIIGWILTEAMGLSAYIFGPSSEGKFASHSIVGYFFDYLYYIDPAIYLLTLVFFIGLAIYQFKEFLNSKKAK